MRILRRRGDLIISETSHGFVCANAGIDLSNVERGEAALLPEDPDRSARRIRDGLRGSAGVEVGVVVSDTFGRPWRRGVTDVAIGCAGLRAVIDLRGTHDAYGRELQVTEVAVVDEIAAAAELVMGKATGVPVAVIRGLDPSWFLTEGERSGVLTDVVRSPAEDSSARDRLRGCSPGRRRDSLVAHGDVPDGGQDRRHHGRATRASGSRRPWHSHPPGHGRARVPQPGAGRCGSRGHPAPVGQQRGREPALDLADLRSVRAFAEELSDLDRIDVLVNNAGLLLDQREETAQGFELVFGTNHLGPFLLTDLLLDQLRAAPAARIVNVASFGHTAGDRRHPVVRHRSPRPIQRMAGVRGVEACEHPSRRSPDPSRGGLRHRGELPASRSRADRTSVATVTPRGHRGVDGVGLDRRTCGRAELTGKGCGHLDPPGFRTRGRTASAADTGCAAARAGPRPGAAGGATPRSCGTTASG